MAKLVIISREEALASVDPTHARCRDYNHAWDDNPSRQIVVTWRNGEPATVERFSLCLRCGATKKQEFSVSYDITGRMVLTTLGKPSVKLPKGYLKQTGGAPLSKNDVRAARYEKEVRKRVNRKTAASRS